MFSGLSANTAINTASFDGKATLGGNLSITRGDLGNRVQLKYLVSTGEVQVIRNNSTLATFSPSDLSTDSGPGHALFERGTVIGVDLPQESLDLRVPKIDGVSLSYTRLGTYAKVNVNIFNINSSSLDPLAAFVFGQPTDKSGMPSGSATYTSDLSGAVVIPDGTSTQFFSLGNGHGSATFSVDFTQAMISTLINLDASGRSFGTLTGSGSIASGGPAFNGTVSGAGTGEFTGSFFGPNAAEMGYVFEAQGSDFLTYGQVFGVKDSPPPP